jgi:chaperonin GroES
MKLDPTAVEQLPLSPIPDDLETLEPLNDRVVLEVVGRQGVTRGGVILPDNATQEEFCRGRVLASGPGLWLPNGALVPTNLNPGDIVLFQRHASTKVKIGTMDVVLVNWRDVAGKLVAKKAKKAPKRKKA